MNVITLTWQGKSYPVRPTMDIIMAVEDVVTLGQLARASQANDPPLGKLARAYATVLRMSGVPAEDIDVYRSMFGPEADMRPLATINKLLSLLVPPDALVARGTAEGNAPAPAPAGARTSSSPRRRSRRASVAAGAAPESSAA